MTRAAGTDTGMACKMSSARARSATFLFFARIDPLPPLLHLLLLLPLLLLEIPSAGGTGSLAFPRQWPRAIRRSGSFIPRACVVSRRRAGGSTL